MKTPEMDHEDQALGETCLPLKELSVTGEVFLLL